MSRLPHEILTEILAASDPPNPPNGPRLTGLVREFRNALGYSPTKFAQALGVSVPTVHRWEKNSDPPKYQLLRFSSLVNTTVEPPLHRHHALKSGGFQSPPDGTHFAVRPLEHIVAQERHASEVWVIRASNDPFLSGYDGPTRQEMLELLIEKPEMQYCFLFYTDDKELQANRSGRLSTNQALDSHLYFLRAVVERENTAARPLNLFNRVRGWNLNTLPQAGSLGLGAMYSGVVLEIYDADGQTHCNRKYDLFQEVNCAYYEETRANGSMTFRRLEEGARIWIEAAPSTVDAVFLQWDQALQEIKQMDSVIKDRDALKTVRPGLLLPSL